MYKNKLIFRRWIASGIMLLLGILLYTLSACAEGFADGYATSVYRFIAAVLSSITGIFPFSVYEIIILLTIAAGLFGIVWLIVKLIRGKGRRLHLIGSAAATVITVAAAIFLVFMLNCGINYHRAGFTADIGMNLESEYTNRDLADTYTYLISKVNELAPQVERLENRRCAEPETLRADAVAAMAKLGQKYPCLDISYPRAKAVLCSHAMGMAGITGMFSPFTIEANYNKDDAPCNLGFTICHELSHLCGFMDEKEANFIAYLACINSDSVYLQYCGYFAALWYCAGDYYDSVTPTEYDAAADTICTEFWLDSIDSSDYWSSFYSDGDDVLSAISNGVNDLVSSVSTSVNDAYLTINGVDEGVMSYGKVSWLIVADYCANRR